MLIKYSGVKPDVKGVILKPILAGLACGASAYVTAYLLGKLGIHNMLLTVVSILVAVIVYVVAVILFKIIKKSDIISLPKGEKLIKVLEKFKVLG